MGMKQPRLKSSSVEEFISICDGSFFGQKYSQMTSYGPIKYMGAMWMSSLAREYPEIRFVTMSPGGTSGTGVMNGMPSFMEFMFKHIAVKLMPLMGMMHKLELGAKRYVDGLNDESYQSGVFYGSQASVLTGPLVDQSTIFKDINNQVFQDNARKAIHRFIS